jgi:hypothetical protein
MHGHMNVKLDLTGALHIFNIYLNIIQNMTQEDTLYN